jgi:hypothetical protein
VFGVHSYAFTHLKQHAEACLRNAALPTKEAQAEIKAQEQVKGQEDAESY